jgi:hypothetical protein
MLLCNRELRVICCQAGFVMKFTLGRSHHHIVGPFQGGNLFWFGPLFSDVKDVNSSPAYCITVRVCI